jgi:hypothetical protein
MPDNTEYTLLAASCVLAVGAYGIVGALCTLLWCDRVVYAVYDYLRERK